MRAGAALPASTHISTRTTREARAGRCSEDGVSPRRSTDEASPVRGGRGGAGWGKGGGIGADAPR